MTLLRVHAIAAWAFVITILVQVFYAGAAITALGGSGSFRTHIDFGYTVVGIAAAAVLVTAILARRGRREIGFAAGLLGLYIVQTSLPYAKGSLPWVAALHPVNALLLFALAAWYARRAWRAGTPG